MSTISRPTSRKLEEIAGVFMGYPASRHSDSTGTYSYRPFCHDGNSTDSSTLSYDVEIPKYYLTEVDDIIISVQDPRSITLIDGSHVGFLITNNYIIIRCNKRKAHAGYVFLRLKSLSHDKKFAAVMRDAVLPSQRVGRLKSLKVELLPLREQEAVYNTEKELSDMLTRLVESINENKQRKVFATQRIRDAWSRHYAPEYDNEYSDFPLRHEPSETDGGGAD